MRRRLQEQDGGAAESSMKKMSCSETMRMQMLVATVAAAALPLRCV